MYFTMFINLTLGDKAMKVECIINPTAGKGRALKVWQQIHERLEKLYPNLKVSFTKGPGDGTALASAASGSGTDLIITLGGDGTIHDVINGMMEGGGGARLAIIPAGTGNDLAKELGVSENLDEALNIIANNKGKKIDLGLLNGRYFINMAGLGFDAAVAHRVNDKRIMKGKAAYLSAIMQTILFHEPVLIKLSIDGVESIERITLIAIGNGRYVGGGIKMLPHAIVDDGFLNICLVKETSRLEILKTLPAVYQGKHVNHPKCIFLQGQHIVISDITARQQVYAHVDGQEFIPDVLEFSILSQCLEVIHPFA